MPLGPVVPRTRLPKNKVVGSEDLTVRPRPDAVHGARFKVHENRSRHEPSATGLVVVNIDPLELQLGVPIVPPGGVDAMLRTNHFPELGTDLVAALATLNVKDLTHLLWRKGEKK